MNQEETIDFNNELFEHYQFKADKGQEPLRVDKFLINRIENASRNKIQSAAKNGFIFFLPIKLTTRPLKTSPDPITASSGDA